MLKKSFYLLALVVLLGSVMAAGASAENKLAVNTGVDIYNRYVWRGLDIANTPSIQPSMSVTYAGFEFGAWGAYTLSNQASESDEIDFWLSYTMELNNGVSFTLLATDYYFPNKGIKFFNFNDYDAVIDDTIPDYGAHTLELGLSVAGPESFPITVSGYVNVYNDGGNNTYFQVDYPVTVGETELGLFCGAAGGCSKEYSGYYGTENLNVINLGVSAARDIKVTDSFSLPLSVSMVLNPRNEIMHLLVGFTF